MERRPAQDGGVMLLTGDPFAISRLNETGVT